MQNMMPDSKPTRVAFLTLSSDSSAKSFIIGIGKELPNHTCKYVQLSNYDLGLFHMQLSEGYDAVVLLHSVQEGRNAVTDFPDGRYNNLLPHLKYEYGADRVAVIVFSMPSLQQSSKKNAMMMAFEDSQPTTFVCSKCVIQCNDLHTMDMDYRRKLISFLNEASNSRKMMADRSTNKKETVKSEEYYDNAVALINHSGPDISDTLELSSDLKTRFADITFVSLDKGSMNNIHLFKSVLVLVDKKDCEYERLFAYLTTSYINKIEPKGRLGLLIMKKTDESVSIRDFNRLPRVQLFSYSREQQEDISGKSTPKDMMEWFTKDCSLLQHIISCGLCSNSWLWWLVDWFFLSGAQRVKGQVTHTNICTL